MLVLGLGKGGTMIICMTGKVVLRKRGRRWYREAWVSIGTREGREDDCFYDREGQSQEMGYKQ